MATRTSRRGGGKEHTPVVSGSSQRIRPPSPLSPTRVSRVEEKQQMRNLNDRLACYIEKVRQQNVEIDHLSQQISTIEETKNSEITSIKYIYDKELAHTRKAVDELAKERAKLQIDAEKLERENRDLKLDFAAKEKAFNQIEKEFRSLQNKHNQIVADNEKFERELNLLRPENAKLKKKLEDAKKNLEAETIMRIDAQNQLQTSREGLKFDNDVLQTQLNESKKIKTVEITEIDGKYQEEYEEKLQKSLADLRDTYEKQIQENRAEFSRVYDAKLAKLQEQLSQERSNSAGNAQEIREMQTKLAGLVSRNSELEASNSALNRRISALINEMEDAAKAFKNEIVRKDADIKSKEQQMEEMLKDYKDLMEVKVGLDMEIAAYQKLLEGEEARLGISQSDSPSYSTPVHRGAKRKRTMMEEEEQITFQLISELSGKGNIIIEPLEENGKYIRLLNKTEEEINIGGWKLTNTTGSIEATYKFHRSTTLAPGATTTVYSSDVKDVEHAPPQTLIMKNGVWTVGDINITVLVNKEGEEESVRKTQKEKQIAGITREGLYHTAHSENEKNCIVM